MLAAWDLPYHQACHVIVINQHSEVHFSSFFIACSTMTCSIKTQGGRKGLSLYEHELTMGRAVAGTFVLPPFLSLSLSLSPDTPS